MCGSQNIDLKHQSVHQASILCGLQLGLLLSQWLLNDTFTADVEQINVCSSCLQENRWYGCLQGSCGFTIHGWKICAKPVQQAGFWRLLQGNSCFEPHSSNLVKLIVISPSLSCSGEPVQSAALHLHGQHYRWSFSCHMAAKVPATLFPSHCKISQCEFHSWTTLRWEV